MSSEVVQKSVLPMKIHVVGVGQTEVKRYNSCKMEERFGSWRKWARSFCNSRPSRLTPLIVFAIFIAFQAFAFIINGGDGGEEVRLGHSSFTSKPLLSQISLGAFDKSSEGVASPRLHPDVAEEFEDGASIYSSIGSMFSSNQALGNTFDRKRKKKNKTDRGREPYPTNEDLFESVEDSDVSSLLTGAVQFLDGAVEESGSKQMLQTYGMLKGMMAMWNPQASRWAANASAVYKKELASIGDVKASWQWPELPVVEKDSKIEQCGCVRKIRAVKDYRAEDGSGGANASTCSRHSHDRGPQQKTIGFTFYGNPDSKLAKERKYFQGIIDNLKLIPELYPGWVLRLYYDLKPDHPLMEDLCRVACEDANIDLCYVRDIPAAGDVSKVFAMNWRFLPCLDDQVTHYVSRDLDSRINQREVAAVNEWLTDSDSAFHFMRDNPAHAIEILGSAWGVRMRPFERAMMLAAFEAGATDRMFWAPRHAYGPDQGFLKRYVWPWAKWSALSHDSYTCTLFPRTKSFPTRRLVEKNNFVASVVEAGDVMKQHCPSKCRPKDHKDWLYC